MTTPCLSGLVLLDRCVAWLLGVLLGDFGGFLWLVSKTVGGCGGVNVLLGTFLCVVYITLVWGCLVEDI